ncbi:hypothetical protein C6361_26990 [Plantactinospora sp. BC1]|uniref:hypothetical protein n=1 Tax=Plantactinospora sp. BC1 TaxID=2108470 RepID=UPI000D151919|nr:hypothetical protein [Plantactinospora sp. BC1]AVT32505.1 hypothetical protein C6361_26990 [Plantactinospora sp. BC1]
MAEGTRGIVIADARRRIGGYAMDRPLLPNLRDPVADRLLRESLAEQARDDRDPLARDMARDVLDGNITLYQAAASSVYGEVFARRADEHTNWWHGLSEAERERLRVEGREAMAAAREEEVQR